VKSLKRSLFVLFFIFLLFPIKSNAETLRWCGSQLSYVEQEIYKEIVKSYESFEDSENYYFTGIEGCDTDKIYAAAKCFLRDYPEAYWFDGRLFIGDDSIAFGFYDNIAEERKDIDLEIQKAMDYVGTYENDLDKIRAINDYICHHTSYGKTVDQGGTIRGGLLKKYKNTFVCAGHSKLFQLLCVKNDIPCLYLVINKGEHACNYVQYNSKWYMVDVTWNHPTLNGLEDFIHDYLMRGRDAVSKYHQLLDPFQAGSLTITFPELADKSIIYMEDTGVADFSFDDYDWDLEGYYYTGKQIKPQLSRIYAGFRSTNVGEDGGKYHFLPTDIEIRLKKDKDYTLSYRNNINVGKGEVIITGIGRCYGSLVVPFVIKQKKIKVREIIDITISGGSNQIAAGKSLKLSATVIPDDATNKTLKWTSSDTKVATVTQTGKVIIKNGTGGKSVTIKAKATDGSGRSDFFKIKVMKGAVKSIKIKGAKKTLKVGKTMKLKATIKVTKGKPVNKKVKWTSSNKKYATVSSKGLVKALSAGKGKKVKITAMATDGTGKKKVITIKIK